MGVTEAVVWTFPPMGHGGIFLSWAMSSKGGVRPASHITSSVAGTKEVV